MGIDLLFPDPARRLDERAMSETLTFAFATGGGAETFERLLAQAELPASHFDQECFVSDLFLDTFIERCLQAKVAGTRAEPRRGYLKKVLGQGLSDPRVLRHRQDILRELAESLERRAELERLYSALSELEKQLVLAEISKRSNPIARRMEILRSLKAALDLAARSFAGAESGLGQVCEQTQQFQHKDAYRALEQLLDYEDHLATLDVKVRIGRDGGVRSFAIVRAQENRNNPLFESAFVRFWTRLRALFSGYRLAQRELQGRLVQGVFDDLQSVVIDLFQLRADIDFYLAALALSDLARKRGLHMCLPEFTEDAQGELESLFNPFLLLEDDPPVPTDLVLSKGAICIITGPNSGGKTRLLQAVGLCQLLAQAGLFVPAQRARLRLVKGLFVSLVHPTTADAREGRLGTELLRIRRLFEQVGVDSLILVDELCSGTNPSEGEEIFRWVVELLSELEPTAFVSTHFLTFAAGLQQERALDHLTFLQVALDEREDPTYGFVPGVAQTSLAHKTAERLGVTRSALRRLIALKRETGRS